jgi:hypothetical protein
MFSIENFYYILHQHLLKPLNLQDAMFQEFGSVDLKDFYIGRYSTSQYRYRKKSSMENTCYYFDQEPIHTDSVNNLTIFTSSKLLQLLANSEISHTKKYLCQEHNYQNWYYFFHGFAALDWYQDGRYFDQQIDWSRPYITLNRLHTNDRSYRLNLVARLADQQLLDRGHVSLHLGHTEYGTWQQELISPDTRLSDTARELIAQHLEHPLTLDCETSTGSLSANFGHQEFELWKSGLWHIVTETVFYHDKLHLTEKIFKPIVAQRPFMLAAAPGNLAYLKSYGFQTFDQWIDESYDNIQDPDQRLQAIVDQTQRLSAMSDSDLREMHQEMQTVLEHNFDHLWSGFRHLIVDELVNNFETCVRLWNNGRVDGKELPLQNIDLARVKQILLR